MNNILRKEVKLLKALQSITYGEISDIIGTKKSSFYAWLKGQYDFGTDRLNTLKYLIDDLKEYIDK